MKYLVLAMLLAWGCHVSESESAGEAKGEGCWNCGAPADEPKPSGEFFVHARLEEYTSFRGLLGWVKVTDGEEMSAYIKFVLNEGKLTGVELAIKSAYQNSFPRCPQSFVDKNFVDNHDPSNLFGFNKHGNLSVKISPSLYVSLSYENGKVEVTRISYKNLGADPVTNDGSLGNISLHDLNAQNYFETISPSECEEDS